VFLFLVCGFKNNKYMANSAALIYDVILIALRVLFVNWLTIIFHKENLEKYCIILILPSSKNMITGWNTTFQKMLRIAYIVISSHQALEINHKETQLLPKDLELEKERKVIKSCGGLQ
jgi:hypothetical protein